MYSILCATLISFYTGATPILTVSTGATPIPVSTGATQYYQYLLELHHASPLELHQY